jgi:hypothetical protein
MQRTPPNTSKAISQPAGSSEPTTRQGPSKRGRKNAFDDSISPKTTAQSNNEMNMQTILDAIKTAADLQMKKFDELNAAVTTQFVRVNEDIAEVKDRMNQHDMDIEFLRRRVNDIEQDKFAAHMEITGVEKATIEQRQHDLKVFARETIASFGIPFDPTAVQHAFVRNIEKLNKSIIIVVLKSFEEKAHVMRAKRESKDKRPIFFDHRLTHANRVLFSAARKAAKESGGKAYVNRGRIFVAKENNKFRVASSNDIETYKSSLPVPTEILNNTNTAHHSATST